MKIGGNIKEIREFEKNLKRSYVAEKLGLCTRAYANIENNLVDITLGRLKDIALILDCTPMYILSYGDNKRNFYNTFHNNSGNKGTIKINQSVSSITNDIIYYLQKELIESEQKRISLLENILRENNIEF